LQAGFQVAAFDAPGHGTSRGARTTMARIVEVDPISRTIGPCFLIGNATVPIF
jgi:hypothetical protein